MATIDTQPTQQELAKAELNRRKAKAELARRRAASKPQQNPIAQGDKFTQAKRDFGNSAKSAFMQSLSLGTIDNLIGAIGTPEELIRGAFNGQDEGKGFIERLSDAYDRGAIPHREGLDQYARENPGKNLAARLGGGLFLGGGLAAGGITSARAIPQSASGVSRALGNTAAAGVDGAILTGAETAFEGGSAEEIGNASVSGGLFGLGAGALAAPISAAAKKTVDAFRRNFGGDESRAVQAVIQKMEDSGIDPAQAQARLQELGSEAFLADALGAGGDDLGRAVSNSSPEARGILEGATTSRLAGQPERISNGLQEASGLTSRLTPDELVAASQQRSQGRINQAYEAARAAGHDLPIEPFNDLLKSQKVKDALNQGIKLSRERAIAQGGTNNASRLSAFDEAKKVLDAQAQPALGQPQTNEQAISAMLAKRLRGTIDDNVPEYGGARALAQQAKQSEDAIRLGAEGAKRSIPLDFERRILGAHGNADEIAQGFASGKIGQVQNKRPTAGTVDQLFSSPQQQAATRAALGDKAEGFEQLLSNERTFNNTHRAFTGNSTTARQLNELLKFGIGTGGGAGVGAAGSLATGNDPLTGAAAGAAIGAGGRVAQRGAQNFSIKQAEKAAPLIARLLTGKSIPKQTSGGARASRADISERIRLLLSGGFVGSTNYQGAQ